MSEHEEFEVDSASPADELLTAYLDDELAPETRADVEQRLTEDPEFRNQLTHLQRAWDLLDSLPRTEASEDFTHTTVEMVAVRAAASAKTEAINTQRSRLSLLLAGIGTVATAVLGFFGVYSALDAPNRKLLNDLPVIEKLDDYRYADSIEFLESLESEGLFLDEETANDDPM